jgi:hypothetical protein
VLEIVIGFLIFVGVGGGFVAGLALGLWINDDLTRPDR